MLPTKYEIVSKEIPICRIEDVVPEGQRIDLLKLDCEGSEYDIIAGMSDELASRVMRVVGERHGGIDEFGFLCSKKFPHLECRDRSMYLIDEFELVPRV